MEIFTYLKQWKELTTITLKKRLPATNKEPQRVHQAMRYAALGGGKRLRASLVYAVGEPLGAHTHVLQEIAAAIEMIHAFTLIQDDLPIFDNDDLRHGKPTCHKIYGEAVTLLASDALQSLAFETIANIPHKKLPPAKILEIINCFSLYTGSLGSVAGQHLDSEMINKTPSLKKIEKMYRLKTGSELTTSILSGMLASNCKDKKIAYHLNKFADYIGVAFQIQDDIVGIESDTKTLGKKQGADIILNKPVYPVIATMEIAKRRAQRLYRNAITHLENIEKLTKAKINFKKLKALTAYIIERNH